MILKTDHLKEIGLFKISKDPNSTFSFHSLKKYHKNVLIKRLHIYDGTNSLCKYHTLSESKEKGVNLTNSNFSNLCRTCLSRLIQSLEFQYNNNIKK